MRWDEWRPVYERIVEDMGYDRAGDESSVRLLKAVTVNCDLVDPDDCQQYFGRTCTVVGDADCLEEDLSKHGTEGRLVSSGSAVRRLQAAGFKPDVVVTDLDGDMPSQLAASSAGALTFIHAHGDNADAIREWAWRFEGPVVLTTQSAPESTVFDFGGFTDGDRAVCISQEMGALRIVLRGFDFDHPRTKAGTDPGCKARKLAWARRIITALEGVDVVMPDGSPLSPTNRCVPTDPFIEGWHRRLWVPDESGVFRSADTSHRLHPDMGVGVAQTGSGRKVASPEIRPLSDDPDQARDADYGQVRQISEILACVRIHLQSGLGRPIPDDDVYAHRGRHRASGEVRFR